MSKDEMFVSINYANKNGTDYKIGLTQKKANKRTHIYCEDNHVIWRQLYPAGLGCAIEEKVICQPSTFIETGVICVLVISGKPGSIAGLEEGVFLSAKSWGDVSFDKIYVISEKAFAKLKLDAVNTE